MLDAQRLYAVMDSRGCDGQTVARALGISPESFENKLKNGDLGLDEANSLIKLLHISSPELIFFPKE